ncbi:MAG TPA: hypothetical protein VG318_09215 [Actinomycetota bacterium]|nr:hypothetical protein [Actinomycetota bacterium]
MRDRTKVVRRGLAAAVTALCALAALAPVAAGKPGGSADRSGLVILGRMEQPPIDSVQQGQIVQLDPARKKLFYVYMNDTDGLAAWLVEYDLRTPVPSMVRSGRIGGGGEIPAPSPYSTALDSARQRLLFLRPNQAGENTILVVDTKRFEPKATWSLTRSLPGFFPMGMTYSARDDKVYVVGEMSQSLVVANSGSGQKVLGPGTSIVALDGKTGAFSWATPLPECQQALYTLGVGALVARSANRPALHVACSTGGSGAGDAFPGQAGLIRVTVDPKASAGDALGFQREFFPISGSYFSGAFRGIAAFDPKTDRFFLQSLARSTPGAWVFDGRLSAWVGFITAPDSRNYWTGLNTGTGKFYMGSPGSNGEVQDSYLLVADGRATPVPQGGLAKLTVSGFMPTDPSTNRVFVPTLDRGRSGYYHWTVVRDDTPQAEPLRPPDYDALTSDIEETDKTVTNFSGGVNGYGARAVLVGGYRGALNFAGQYVTVSQLRQGDRGLTAARVPSLDLRPVGASATAQALVEDSSTEAELKEGAGAEWPWTPASCLDGSGDVVEGSGGGSGGEATVRCDLAKSTVTAESAFGAVSGEGFRIGRSTFSAAARRDLELGVVTTSTATVRGVDLAPPAGGSVSIGEIVATATTSAHGRPGTAKAKWERTLSGVVVRDAEGKVVQRIGECTSTVEEDQCPGLARRINSVLGTRMQVDFFKPDVVRTPKGAFAGIQQTDGQYFNGRTVNGQGTSFTSESGSRAVPALQLTVFNDSVERSRLLLQLASIQTNSIYTIAPETLYEANPPIPVTKEPAADSAASTSTGTTSTTGVTTGTSDVAPLASSDTSVPSDVAAPVAMPVEDVPGVLAFFARGPVEGVMVAAIWILFGCAGGAVLKRRALLEVLKGKAS